MKNLKSLKTIKLLALLLVASFAAVSCSSDDDGGNGGDNNQIELITTVTYTLSDGTNTITLTFQDIDGPGGIPGTTEISAPWLDANTTYTGSIEFLNETENPPGNITDEVEAEAEEHEIFYSTSVAGVNIAKNDTDANGNPVGLNTTFTTGDAASGSLTIVLKHEPTKPNDGTAIGAGGSTDASVTFNIDVQ